MQLHANAKLGLSGRHALVLAIEGGLSPATAHRWWHRWLAAEQQTRGALADRPSRPRRSPRQLSPEQEAPILRARRETGLGPARIAGIVRRAHSTVWKVLRRHGLSRPPRAERPLYRRYEWSRPGALLHVDVKELARFRAPGHRTTGDRRRRSRRAGYDYLHCVVNDHSRFAHVELHPAQDAETCARVARADAGRAGRARRPVKLRPHLQPAQAAQLARRATADQPRSERPWLLHLGPRAAAVLPADSSSGSTDRARARA